MCYNKLSIPNCLKEGHLILQTAIIILNPRDKCPWTSHGQYIYEEFFKETWDIPVPFHWQKAMMQSTALLQGAVQSSAGIWFCSWKTSISISVAVPSLMLLDKPVMIREANILARYCGSCSDRSRGGNKYMPSVVALHLMQKGQTHRNRWWCIHFVHL